MPVNPLDPLHPVLGEPVLITEELRAIKTRLVEDKASIEDLVANTLVEADAGLAGKAILGKTTKEEVHTYLDVEPQVYGTAYFDSPPSPDPTPPGPDDKVVEVSFEEPREATMVLAGNVKYKATTLATTGITVSWATPFELNCVTTVTCRSTLHGVNYTYTKTGVTLTFYDKTTGTASTPLLPVDVDIIAIGR